MALRSRPPNRAFRDFLDPHGLVVQGPAARSGQEAFDLEQAQDPAGPRGAGCVGYFHARSCRPLLSASLARRRPRPRPPRRAADRAQSSMPSSATAQPAKAAAAGLSPSTRIDSAKEASGMKVEKAPPVEAGTPRCRRTRGYRRGPRRRGPGRRGRARAFSRFRPTRLSRRSRARGRRGGRRPWPSR